MSIIKTKHLSYHYIRHDEEGNVEGEVPAVKDVNLSVEPGEFIAILGHNGSGKSTLAKHFNALLLPSEGCIVVDGMDTADENHTWDVRSTAGMVFQNPDNQIIGQVVEEDVGFGPENLGVPTKEIWERVEESLKAVGMYEYRKYSPNKLSGGQKQRVSIAGVLAMHPKCIVLDEPTAMLDPNGRKDVIRAARALNDVENVTIILITHYADAPGTSLADVVLLCGALETPLDGGSIPVKVGELFVAESLIMRYLLDNKELATIARDKTSTAMVVKLL